MVTESRFKIMKNCSVSFETNEYIIYDTKNNNYCKIEKTPKAAKGLANFMEADIISPMENLKEKFFKYEEIKKDKMIDEAFWYSIF